MKEYLAAVATKTSIPDAVVAVIARLAHAPSGRVTLTSAEHWVAVTCCNKTHQ